jgi:aminomethyltransferase
LNFLQRNFDYNGGTGLIAPAGEALKRTALNSAHRASGAKMVDYCGWDMPVEYSGITREHLAVRTAAGLFDVSHMGEIEVRGPQALALLQHVTSNDVSRLQDYQAQYSALMLPQGSCIDDCVVHRFAPDHYFLCVNATNTDKDFAWIVQSNSFGAEVRNISAQYSQIALQGPRAREILAKVAEADPGDLKYYWFRPARCAGVEGLLARTGYTGEDGFEFYFPPASSAHVWNTLLDAGRAEGLIPAGLGARNTLRLEAGYALYGHELDEETTLLEANLGWIAKLEKGDFVGRDVLLRLRAQGTPKSLIGFEMIDRAPARDGYAVWVKGKKAGIVTSGSPAPYLKKNIGMAYVPPEGAEVGGEIQIEIRGRLAPARVVALPFYKRPK